MTACSKILLNAFKSHELEDQITNVVLVDAGMALGDISLELLVKEAQYVLGKFTGESGGFEQENDYTGANGQEQKAWAQREVRHLRSFLAKYATDSKQTQTAPVRFVAGLIVEYAGIAYYLVSPAGPRRGWLVNRISDGKRFRLKCSQLSKINLKH